ncbi:MAM and LDL-receptor class A domain-containing protein 1-like [Orbicella faveolata]|uniref:MAM and LDL-receptor class A domain-containing protein 1-like n=1 Tax=Orbicella faveolata TaxID=48498 RepID=UPI0009E22B0B|nr:MAM and LDL-receptor class A domain-containing protein 1-like [Orbicella faveolata]
MQSKDDDKDWKITEKKTPTKSTGPTADHSTGSGYYGYLEASGIAIGSRASFETPWFAAGEGCNISFFYHMSDRSKYGDSMGTLSVEIKTVDKTWFMVFWKAGDQGNTWHQGTVDLSVYEGLVAVRFTAAKGRRQYSDIALDDIVFSASCGSEKACRSPDVIPIFGTKEETGIHLSVSSGSILGGVNTNHSIRGNLSFTYNTWTHVALQYNDQTKQQVLFVNGRVHQVMSNVSASWLPSNLLLGMDGAQYMAGQIDEVQIWNAAVNVSVFYDKYLRGTEEGLVRYYK